MVKLAIRLLLVLIVAAGAVGGGVFKGSPVQMCFLVRSFGSDSALDDVL